MTEKQTFTIDETAQYLGVSRPTVYAEIHSGRLRSMKIGTGRGRRLIHHKALADYITQRERETAA